MVVEFTLAQLATANTTYFSYEASTKICKLLKSIKFSDITGWTSSSSTIREDIQINLTEGQIFDGNYNTIIFDGSGVKFDCDGIFKSAISPTADSANKATIQNLKIKLHKNIETNSGIMKNGSTNFKILNCYVHMKTADYINGSTAATIKANAAGMVGSTSKYFTINSSFVVAETIELNGSGMIGNTCTNYTVANSYVYCNHLGGNGVFGSANSDHTITNFYLKITTGTSIITAVATAGVYTNIWADATTGMGITGVQNIANITNSALPTVLSSDTWISPATDSTTSGGNNLPRLKSFLTDPQYGTYNFIYKTTPTVFGTLGQPLYTTIPSFYSGLTSTQASRKRKEYVKQVLSTYIQNGGGDVVYFSAALLNLTAADVASTHIALDKAYYAVFEYNAVDSSVTRTTPFPLATYLGTSIDQFAGIAISSLKNGSTMVNLGTVVGFYIPTTDSGDTFSFKMDTAIGNSNTYTYTHYNGSKEDPIPYYQTNDDTNIIIEEQFQSTDSTKTYNLPTNQLICTTRYDLTTTLSSSAYYLDTTNCNQQVVNAANAASDAAQATADAASDAADAAQAAADAAQEVADENPGDEDAAAAAADAAAEATDAANAATDAANAAAEAADAATAAAQDAVDAVAALSAQVTELINNLKKQITALSNLVIKIQKKIKASSILFTLDLPLTSAKSPKFIGPIKKCNDSLCMKWTPMENVKKYLVSRYYNLCHKPEETFVVNSTKFCDTSVDFSFHLIRYDVRSLTEVHTNDGKKLAQSKPSEKNTFINN